MFTVPGNPQAQKRHRTTTFGNAGKTFTREFDPSSSDKADFLSISLNNRPEKPIIDPIDLNLTFLFPRPASHYVSGNRSKPLKKNAPTAHVSKPDIDNLVKFVMDALNGKFWLDDKQVYHLVAVKVYSEVPATRIVISWGHEPILFYTLQ